IRLPAKEIQKGPKRSCNLPARGSVAANITTARVKTVEVWARLQPNSCSSGATKTLQPYSVPKARVIKVPPNRRHQGLIVDGSAAGAVGRALVGSAISVALGRTIPLIRPLSRLLLLRFDFRAAHCLGNM